MSLQYTIFPSQFQWVFCNFVPDVDWVPVSNCSCPHMCRYVWNQSILWCKENTGEDNKELGLEPKLYSMNDCRRLKLLSQSSCIDNFSSRQVAAGIAKYKQSPIPFYWQPVVLCMIFPDELYWLMPTQWVNSTNKWAPWDAQVFLNPNKVNLLENSKTSPNACSNTVPTLPLFSFGL